MKSLSVWKTVVVGGWGGDFIEVILGQSVRHYMCRSCTSTKDLFLCKGLLFSEVGHVRAH
jgi:hypothetical protein